MKRNLLHLSILFFTGIFVASCSSESDVTIPTIAGEWTTIERTFRSDKYPEKTALINEALSQHLAKYRLERDFPEQTQVKISPDTIRGEFKFTATLPGASAPTRSVEGVYKMSGDSILFFDKIGNTSRAKFQVGEKILITFQKMTKADLIVLFEEIETYIILPDDITGELKTKDVR